MEARRADSSYTGPDQRTRRGTVITVVRVTVAMGKSAILPFTPFLRADFHLSRTQVDICISVLFLGAVFVSSNGKEASGDVELHLRARDWWSHNHHLDPNYNSVALHVVWENNGGPPTTLQSGRVVPLLVMGDYLSPEALAAPSSAWEPCRGAAQALGAEPVWGILGKAGEQRLKAKGRRLFPSAVEIQWDERLYQGIMEALGYSRNREPFLKLARSLPWRQLQELGFNSPSEGGAASIEATLLGVAGLLPSQRRPDTVAGVAHPYIENLEGVWASSGFKAALEVGDWKSFRVRAANLPARRLAGAARLFSKYLDRSLTEGLVTPLVQGTVPQAIRAAEASLTVNEQGYWAHHGDFGQRLPRPGSAIIGRERARIIAVNVLLPALWAWGLVHTDPAVTERALELFRSYPKHSADRVTRHMAEKLGLMAGSKRLPGAQEQQGMHHLYKERCVTGVCQGCPIARSMSQRGEPY
ncbi:MAG: hypothetical protein HW388_1770 [Dehalococcoidia bacterium]|nr:hypothetical protein [Dehalococcoidia bacterium]